VILVLTVVSVVVVLIAVGNSEINIKKLVFLILPKQIPRENCSNYEKLHLIFSK
jgi:hypothetical protein